MGRRPRCGNYELFCQAVPLVMGAAAFLSQLLCVSKCLGIGQVGAAASFSKSWDVQGEWLLPWFLDAPQANDAHR